MTYIKKPIIIPTEDIGKTKGYLVITRVFNIGRAIHYTCKCICGKEIEIPKSKFNGVKKKSCGCMYHPKGKNNHRWRGYGDIGASYWKQVISSAKRRNLEFSISIEFAWNLFLQQDSKCAISKLPIELVQSMQDYRDGLMTASLDRKDSNVGYIETNVQWVHKDINKIKTDFDQDYFIELCKAVASNN